MNQSVVLVPIIAATSLWWSCSKSEGKKSSEESTKNVAETGTVALTGELAASYPQGLSVTAFPQAVDETPGAAAPGTVLLLTQNDQYGDGEFKPFAQHPKKLLQIAKERLDGTATDCFDADIIAAMFRQVNVGDACYGFDYGMVDGTAIGDIDPGKANQALQNVADQSLAGLKAKLMSIEGIMPDTTAEACMVKVGRQMVEQAASRVEGTLRVIEGMLCQAKKDKIAEKLPDVGESLDLKDAFASYQRATFSEASITRLSDQSGRPVYRSRLAFTVNGGVAAGNEMSVTLVHSPSADNNVEYDGVMWFQGDRVGPQATGNYKVVTSISYAKSGSDVTDQRLRMEMRNAEFNKDKVTADVVSSDGTIDLNPGIDAQGNFGPGVANDYVTGIRYFGFDINPSTYAGNISFWNNPGGSYNEDARGFLFESTQADDGTLSGCAYSGAARGTSIRKAVREGLTLEPTGCFTPQLSHGDACGNGSNNAGTQIWKQCFKQKSDGYYLVDDDKVTSPNGFDIIDLGAGTAPTLPVVAPPSPGAVGSVRD